MNGKLHSIEERQRNSLTSDAFAKFLFELDVDRERAGEKYEQIRKGLNYFFQCRGCTFVEDHTDETINRVARKLGDGEDIRDVYTYVYGVARLIVLEVFKQREKERLAVVQLASVPPRIIAEEASDNLEEKLGCLRKCLATLPVETRGFITQYYVGQKRSKIDNRKKLAEEFRIPLNALRLRARRIREKLEACVSHCMDRVEAE